MQFLHIRRCWIEHRKGSGAVDGFGSQTAKAQENVVRLVCFDTMIHIEESFGGPGSDILKKELGSR